MVGMMHPHFILQICRKPHPLIVSNCGVHLDQQTCLWNVVDYQEQPFNNNRIPQIIWDSRYKCLVYIACTTQMSAYFGFIPISPLKVYYLSNYWDKQITDVIALVSSCTLIDLAS